MSLLGQVAAVAWELGAATFIVLVILTVRKARGRGRRLFVDQPKRGPGIPEARPYPRPREGHAVNWSVGDRVRLQAGGVFWRIERVLADGFVDLRSTNPARRSTRRGVDASRLLPLPKKGDRVPIRQRFLAHLAFDGDCVVWASSLTTSGYAQFRVEGRKQYAHRWFWESEMGPVPAGLELDHLCRNRACVNLAHLEPVTPRENVRRGTSPIAEGMRQTHCVNHHPFAGENLLIRNNGQRACRICCRENARRKRAKAKEVREPLARVKALHQDTSHRYEQDA